MGSALKNLAEQGYTGLMTTNLINRGKTLDPLATKSEAFEIDEILHSDLFDPTWYASCYPDVAKSEMLPEYHYYFYGGPIGRPASSSFGPKIYPDIYHAAKDARRNPLSLFLAARKPALLPD